MITDLLWRLLGVVVAAVAGGFASGAAVQTAVERRKLQERPGLLARGSRIVGGAGAGLLAALGLLGHGGGWGFGLGGPGTGSGNGTEKNGPVAVEKRETREPEAERPFTSPSEIVRIEVLGDPTLRRALGDRFDASHCYRLEVAGENRLLTLAELKDMFRKRQESQLPLRKVVLTLYNDSPAEDVPRVADLRRWIQDELPPRPEGPVEVDVEKRGQNAPAK